MKALVANTNRTLVKYALDNPRVREEYVRRWWGDEVDRFDHSNRTHRSHLKQARTAVGYSDQVFPNSRRLLRAARKAGFGIVIYAGAPTDKTRELYKRLSVGIDGAYQAAGNRRSAGNFRSLGRRMSPDGFDPVAYLTDRKDHAEASADAYGKALLCMTEERHTDFRIHTFDGMG